MVTRRALTRILANLAILVLVVLPVWVCVAWVTQVVVSSGNSSNRTAWGVTYVALILPALVGGAAHQAILALIPLSKKVGFARVIAGLTGPIIPIVGMAVGTPLFLWAAWPDTIAAFVALVLYAALLRLPIVPSLKAGVGANSRDAEIQ